jgi:hypothetical protein
MGSGWEDMDYRVFVEWIGYGGCVWKTDLERQR